MATFEHEKEDRFRTFLHSELMAVLSKSMAEYSRLHGNQRTSWLSDAELTLPPSPKEIREQWGAKKSHSGSSTQSPREIQRRTELSSAGDSLAASKPPLASVISPGPSCRRVSWGASDENPPKSNSLPPLHFEDIMKSGNQNQILAQEVLEEVDSLKDAADGSPSAVKTTSQELEAVIDNFGEDVDEDDDDNSEWGRDGSKGSNFESGFDSGKDEATEASMSPSPTKLMTTDDSVSVASPDTPLGQLRETVGSPSNPSLASLELPLAAPEPGTKFKMLDTWGKMGNRQVDRKVSAFSRSSTTLSITGFSSEDPKMADSDLDSCASSLESLADILQPSIQTRIKRRFGSMTRRMMMMPNSRIPVIWEIVGFVWICWDIMTIPFQIFEPEDNYVTMAMSWLIRLFWMIDVPFSIFIGYTAADGALVLSMRAVAKRYLRTNFVFDLALVIFRWTAFAIDTVNIDGDAVKAILTILNVLQLFRLYRMVRIWRITEEVFMQVRSEERVLVWHIFIGGLLLLTIIHVLGCLWQWVSEAEFNEAGDDLANIYMRTVHIVLALLIGEHVVLPESLVQRVFCVVMLLFGFLLTTASIGALTTTLARLQELARQRSKQFALLNRFLAENAISSTLSARINRNAHYAFSEQKMHIQENQVELMALVSEQLRVELRYEMHVTLLSTHPFCQLFDILHSRTIQTICSNAVSIMRITRSDVIFTTMEVPHKPAMYLFKSGSFRYLSMEGAQSVGDGAVVAEACLWTSWTHCGTMKALKDSHIMLVDAQAFAKAVRKAPFPHTRLYAIKFVEYLNTATVPSDIGPERFQNRSMALEVFVSEDPEFLAPPEWGSKRRRSSNLSTLMSADNSGILKLPGAGRRPSMSQMVPGRRSSKTSVQDFGPVGSMDSFIYPSAQKHAR